LSHFWSLILKAFEEMLSGLLGYAPEEIEQMRQAGAI
jgi:hypothetical protein